MIRKLLFSFTFMVFAATMVVAQINTVGLIGTGSPTAGWEDDTDLTQDPMNADLWTGTMTLTTGAVKFRANDDWDINWGNDAGDFPSGVAAAGAGNLNAVSGEYNISLNTATGEYNFENTAVPFTNIGIIGTATPNGWDSDTDMVQDMNNPYIWTLEITLVDGAAKFRADDLWEVSWGGDDFPTGFGTTMNGGDIPVVAGDYIVTLNTGSGEYDFGLAVPEYGTIGMAGTGSPGGSWDMDTDMYQDMDQPNLWKMDAVQIQNGMFKFRAEDSWDFDNWGDGPDATWPSGTAVKGAQGNITSQAGEYNVTFDILTGEYTFEPTFVLYNSIGIIGTATPNGWADPDTDMEVNPNNPSEWFLQTTLTDGVLKFRANDMWEVAWGNANSDFPSGIGSTTEGDITVVAGEYKITFNSATGAYSFDDPITQYTSVAIVGAGTTNGWDGPDLDLTQDAVQTDQWTGEVYLNGGAIKFRANDEWVVDWGSANFPVGNGTQGGEDIPASEGSWAVTFNSTSGFYTFTPVSIGVIGSAANGWDEGDDVPMQASGEETNHWSVSLPLIGGNAAKFRKDGTWTINWGSDMSPGEYPTGTGVQDGTDIIIPEDGTYDVSINTLTGVYVFTLDMGTATNDLLNPKAVRIFPNPTSDRLFVTIDAPELSGKFDVKMMDITGKVIEAKTVNAQTNLDFDVSNYPVGSYIIHLSNDKFTIGKQFVIAK